MKKYKSIGIWNKSKNKYIHSYECKKCGVLNVVTYADKTIYHSFLCFRYSHTNKHLCVPVHFINVITGERSKAKSITDFCKHHPDLGKNSKYHFSEILKEKRLHYKGWMLKDNYSKNKLVYGNRKDTINWYKNNAAVARLDQALRF